MGTKLSLAKRTLIVLLVFALVAIGYFSNALAQTRTLSCQRADGTWYEGECKPSGGGVPGGGRRGPDILDSLIDNVIAPLFGYSSPAEAARIKQANNLHQQGNDLYNRRDYRGALSKYQAALSLVPSSNVFRGNVANTESILAYEAGNLELAIAKAREALGYRDMGGRREWLQNLEMEFTEEQAISHNQRGGNLFKQGKYADAEAAYREAIRLNPNGRAFHYNLGLALEEQRRFAEAEASYRRAVELNPKNANGHYKLGLMQIYLGRYAEAEKAYRAAAQLSPSDANTRISLGFALEKQGRRGEAEAEYREAVKLAPGNYWGHLKLGDLLRNSKKYSDAEAPYREAVRLEPKNTDARFGLAYTLMEQGKREEAEAQYREVIRLNPQSTGARLNLANSLLDRNQAREAESLLREVIKLSPRDVDAYNSLGLVLKRQGQYREAEAAYGKALEIHPSYEVAQDNLKAMRSAIESKADSIWATIFPAEQSTALQRAQEKAQEAQANAQRKAREEAESTKAHGQAGAGGSSDEEAKDQAEKVFDKLGVRVPPSSSTDVVETQGLGKRIEISPELANHPKIKALQKEREALEGQRKSLEKELDLIRQKKARGEGNKGELEVQEAKKKQEISNVTSKIGVVDVKMESFVINLTRASTPPDTDPNKQKTPSGKKFQVEFVEEPSPKQQPTRPPAERKP